MQRQSFLGKKFVCAAAVAGLLVVGFALIRPTEPVTTAEAASSRPTEAAPAKGQRAESTKSNTASTGSAVLEDTSPKSAPEEHSLEDLLEGDSEWAAIAAIRGSVEIGDTRALPVLERVRLPDHPGIAPAIIKAVADLGNLASEDARGDAAFTLVDWYRQEERRDGRDALGNRAAIVEALAALDSATARQTLGEWVDEDRLPMHLAIIASRELLKSGDFRAVEAVQRFDKRIAARPEADGVEGALRQELLALVDEFEAGRQAEESL